MEDTTKPYVIYWTSALGLREWQEFDSLEEAQATLDEWTRQYPWDTYHLATVVGVAERTQERSRDLWELTKRRGG